ncbi:transposase [Scytonema sp. PCC 10023]|uniref:transposase n=1 Tax=Scytonema sp. PCC 10023 TaxID=1680591 RepID=UPI0039C64109
MGRARSPSHKKTGIFFNLDAETYSTLQLVGLYDERWDVELNFKHLKTTLGMEILRGKTPQMVSKEIYIYLLAYNLPLSLMWKAGTTYGVPPLRLSLQGTGHPRAIILFRHY